MQHLADFVGDLPPVCLRILKEAEVLPVVHGAAEPPQNDKDRGADHAKHNNVDHDIEALQEVIRVLCGSKVDCIGQVLRFLGLLRQAKDEDENSGE